MNTQKVSMYEISKELVLEKVTEKKSEESNAKEKVKAITSIEIKEANSNNCKYFKKICDLFGIEADKFKVGNEFVFDYDSKEHIKDIVKNHAAYSKAMKQKPNERPVATVNQLNESFTRILKNEITNQNELNSYLAKVELITSNSVQATNNYLKKIATLDFEESINEEDNAVIHLFYLKELELLQSKMERIRELFSDIRSAEIAGNSLQEHDLTDSNQGEDSKIIISKAIAKQIVNQGINAPDATKDLTYEIAVRLGFINAPLYDPKSRFQKKGERVTKQVSTTVKNKVIAELKEFLKKPESNEKFRFDTPKSYYAGKYESPQTVLNEAIQIYVEEQETEMALRESDLIDIEELEQIIKEFNNQK